MDALDRTLRERSSLTIFIVALVIVAAIGWLDFASGVYLSFALFYLVPIGFVTSYSGRGSGILVAIVCASVGLVGDVYQHEAGFLPIWNAAMRLGVFIVVAIVLARLREAHQRERELARTDPLTGVANYRWFGEEAQREMYSSRRYGGPLSLAYIDLDGFKSVNDEHGHGAGDSVLRVVADTLRESLRPTDLVARPGGDEFAVLLPHTDCASAELALDRVLIRLADDPAAMGVGFSIGVIQLHNTVGSIDDLLGAADERMYTAKAAKKQASIGGGTEAGTTAQSLRA